MVLKDVFGRTIYSGKKGKKYDNVSELLKDARDDRIDINLIDLSHQGVCGLTFSDNVFCADFRGSSICEVEFNHCFFDKAMFDDAFIHKVTFHDCLFGDYEGGNKEIHDVCFKGSRLNAVIFEKGRFISVDFGIGYLDSVSFRDCRYNCNGICFDFIDIRRCLDRELFLNILKAKAEKEKQIDFIARVSFDKLCWEDAIELAKSKGVFDWAYGVLSQFPTVKKHIDSMLNGISADD